MIRNTAMRTAARAMSIPPVVLGTVLERRHRDAQARLGQHHDDAPTRIEHLVGMADEAAHLPSGARAESTDIDGSDITGSGVGEAR
jgi:hypothetical protein